MVNNWRILQSNDIIKTLLFALEFLNTFEGDNNFLKQKALQKY